MVENKYLVNYKQARFLALTDQLWAFGFYYSSMAHLDVAIFAHCSLQNCSKSDSFLRASPVHRNEQWANIATSICATLLGSYPSAVIKAKVP